MSAERRRFLSCASYYVEMPGHMSVFITSYQYPGRSMSNIRISLALMRQRPGSCRTERNCLHSQRGGQVTIPRELNSCIAADETSGTRARYHISCHSRRDSLARLGSFSKSEASNGTRHLGDTRTAMRITCLSYFDFHKSSSAQDLTRFLHG